MIDPFGGNATAEMAAALALGRTRNLSLCTERDWFIIDLTDPAQPMPTSLRVSATAGQDDGNLELSLYPEGFVPGQRPLSDASTDANPERLTADALPGGRYLLAVHAFVGAGQVQQAISYDRSPASSVRAAPSRRRISPTLRTGMSTSWPIARPTTRDAATGTR